MRDIVERLMDFAGSKLEDDSRKEIETLRRSLAAARRVIESNDAIRAIQDGKLNNLNSAINSLDSERSANAILTAELETLRNDRDALQDAVISRDVTIETLRQRVNDLEAGLEVATEIINSHASELATLKQAQAPALYQCTKCGGANYGCTCDGLKDCTHPLYAAPTIQAGWQLVPRRVTPEIEAVYGNDNGAYQTAQELHNAMLSASPKPGKPA